MTGMDCVIFTTGGMAAAMLETVTDILGNREACTVISNNDDDCARMQRELEDAARAAGAGSLVVFTDVKGGSCWNVAADSAKRFGNMRLVSGVNMPMLLKFFTWRGRVPDSELLDRSLAAGTGGIGRA